MLAEQLKDKVPPRNDDAERATLGAVLLESSSLEMVISYLRPEDFYKSSHKKIFAACLSLSNEGESIDLITLTDRLKASGELESCGGYAYIAGLTSSVPSTKNIEYYAKIVTTMHLRRSLLRIAEEIKSDAHDESREARQIVEEAEKKIFEITDNHQGHSFKAARDIVNETIEAIEKLYNTRDTYTGVPSGFPKIDQMTSGFQNAEFIILGARPSIGKTAFALNMAANMAIHEKISVGFFTLEMSAMALMQRLLSSEARINSEKLRSGMLKPSDFHNLAEAAGRIYDSPLYIDDTPSIKLLDLRAQARRMKQLHNIRILFIDYITLINAESKDMVRHEQIAEISRSLKALARELNIPIVALSQVSRDTEGKAPILANLRESGSLEQDADVVMFLHRDRGSSNEVGGEQKVNNIETELIIAKQRNGPVGTIKIAFLPQYTKFESSTQDHG